MLHHAFDNNTICLNAQQETQQAFNIAPDQSVNAPSKASSVSTYIALVPFKGPSSHIHGASNL